MALPMASVNDSAREIRESLTVTSVRYTELRPTPAAQPQEEIIGGPRYPWRPWRRCRASQPSAGCLVVP